MKPIRSQKNNPRIFLLILSSIGLTLAGLGLGGGALSHSATVKSGGPRTPDAFSNAALVRSYQKTITASSMASRLYFLASDEFEGRETTTRGQKLAAQYLASQYQAMGLVPKGGRRIADPLSPAAYLQPFPVYKREPKETQLDVMLNGRRIAASTFSEDKQDDLSYFLDGDIRPAAGSMVFAGYGIADDALAYNDYTALSQKGISIEGRWVLILDDEPLSDAATSLLPTPDRKPSSWSTQFVNKKRALWNAGKASGVLVVKDLSPRTEGSFAESAARAAGNARTTVRVRLGPTSPFPPTYAISTKLANQILSSTGKSVEDLKRDIDQSLKPSVFALNSVTVQTTVKQFDPLETENVLALIEGSDPQLRDEVVVISSHYDHLGLNSALKDDQIFNGAADDGSGVVASLEIAQAFTKAKRAGFGPRRSLLFINFSGEEKGLLGSSYYTNYQPIVPLEQTVANINMDGVGGVDLRHPSKSRNYIYINGAKGLSEELIDINKRIRSITASSVELTDGPGFNSDDRNFQAQQIPFIYYSTGLTEHYHTTQDEPETIDYDHLARVTQLILGTVWQIANQDARLRGVKRSELIFEGYVCPPCPFACDQAVYRDRGECPVCGMVLMSRYRRRAG